MKENCSKTGKPCLSKLCNNFPEEGNTNAVSLDILKTLQKVQSQIDLLQKTLLSNSKQDKEVKLKSRKVKKPKKT